MFEIVQKSIEKFTSGSREAATDRAFRGAARVARSPAAPADFRNRTGLAGRWVRDPVENALVLVWSREDAAQVFDLAEAA